MPISPSAIDAVVPARWTASSPRAGEACEALFGDDHDLAGFRDEVGAFLTAELTDAMRIEAATQPGVFAEGAVRDSWHQALYRRGWVAPAWPVEHGGPGWGPMQRMVFEIECARAGAPLLPAMGIQMCGPVLMRFGTRAQKDHFLPRMLSGEHFWCQGYSEPQAGSDLAALQCAAVREGNDYVVNGTKIWTTHAQHANWIFLLVRTSREGKRQKGITFLLAPMDTPGISVSAIRSMSGEHEVNQLFFDDARIPVANRLGAENEGWAVAKYLLEFERAGGRTGGRATRVLAWLDLVEREANDKGIELAGAVCGARRAELEAELLALEWTQRRYAAAAGAGEPLGDAAASLLKLVAADLYQQAAELALDRIGPIGAFERPADEPGDCLSRLIQAFAPRYLNSRAMSIFGGTSEIQHGIIARAALGL